MSDPRTEILGEIQALRAEVERVGSRAEARELKGRILALAAKAPPSAAAIVAAFLDEARETITRTLGTSAWLEPETREEALAKMDAHPSPASPYNDPASLLSDKELEAFVATIKAAIRWTNTGPKAKAMEMFDLLVAELRRLRGGR